MENQKVVQIDPQIEAQVQAFAAQFHFGVQGLEKTEAQMIADAKRVMEKGYHLRAFDSEIGFLKKAIELFGDYFKIHVPIDYPMGRSFMVKKMRELEYAAQNGCIDCCVCLNYGHIFDHDYRAVEREAAQIQDSFGGHYEKLAFVIPAMLMTDTEIVAVVSALDQAGAQTIKVNPGCGLGASFEEVALIYRKFGHDRFDVHPSGNIRTLSQVETFLELGCTTIHSRAMFEITEEYRNKLYAGKGGEARGQQ